MTAARERRRSRTAGPFRVVLTGGPGGGKTTAADLLPPRDRQSGDHRSRGSNLTVLRRLSPAGRGGREPRSAQGAIYHVQRNLEDIQAHQYPERVLLCDRGTVDGGAYWPEGPEDFFASVGSTLRK